MSEENIIRKRAKSFIYEWVIPFIIAIIAAFLLNKYVFFIMKVPSSSMYPTIQIGDFGIVTRVYNTANLKRGDVVIFKSVELNETLVKRLIGLPGDNVKVSENGDVYINDEKIEQDYIQNNGGKYGEYDVPEGSYFFLGDNRSNSLDSRYWETKYIDAKYIEGKGQFIIFPFNRISKL